MRYKKDKIIGIAIILLFLGVFVFLTAYVSAATFGNVVSNCSAEIRSITANNFTRACDASNGSFLANDDGVVETQEFHKQGATISYAGVKVQSVNTSILDCGSIQQVYLCYESWAGAAPETTTCKRSVNNDTTGTFVNVNATCPGTAANPGVICQNVTANKTWSCGNFFGTSGTRASAYTEVQRATSGANGAWNYSIDVLYFNVTYTNNVAPTIANITSSTILIKGGNQMTIYANTTSNGVNDTNANTLNLYCSNSTTSPSVADNICSDTDTTYPYALTCVYNTKLADGNETIYCRVYDGMAYSSNAPNATYTIDSSAPTLSIISVAGDLSPSYFDTTNDGVTLVNISGESGMSCRWDSSDTTYSLMNPSHSCAISGVYALCNFTDVSTQNLTNRYISCQDSLTNENNATNNLDVTFTLDYTAPTTTDDSVTSFQAPSYIVTISESDNVATSLTITTYYCTDVIGTCTPSTLIDNGGTVTFTSSNRGINYLRYYSVDSAGNTQATQNKTININRYPNLTSATDNSTTIKGGAYVNVSTVSFDSDTPQGITLFVCNSSSATSSGCTDTQYCTSSGTANLSCAFASETDSATHSWYAFIYDDLSEAASNNSISGSYVTDSIGPVITIITPSAGQNITQQSFTFQASVNEQAGSVWYSLNSGSVNVTMSNSSLYLYSHTNSSIPDGDYNITFYANDSYGNIATPVSRSFNINTTVPDTTPPVITVESPDNNTYYTSASILLNITANENISWAGYKINTTAIANLGNTSLTSWNATYSFSEGTNTVTFYANDSSNNQNIETSIIYVDLTNPAVSSFLCNSTVNDSMNLICNASFSDAVGLDYAILSYNFSGSFANTSQIDLSGTSNSTYYTFLQGNYTPGSYSIILYLYDLSGRVNNTYSQAITVLDDTVPVISSIMYSPNTSSALDPNVNVTINASITEDYSISSVKVYYKNISDSSWNSSSMTNTSMTAYNTTILFGAGNWTFYINATDSAGNTALSSNYTFNVENDISQNVTTNITSIKSFTYAQRTSSNELGYLILNTTSDTALNYNVSIQADSAIISRFNLNNTLNQTENYSASSGEVIYVPLKINLTDLTSGLYPYNISVVSEVGTEIIERNLYIQIAVGPYLSTSITEYSSSVTRGQSGITLSSSVQNLGTSDAQGVYLSWTLPSGFTLSSGSLVSGPATIAVGASGTNTITVSVSSSMTESSVIINATATSTNANSSSASKTITISNPLTVTETVATTTSGGGGGVSSTASKQVFYNNKVEVVRGETNGFYIYINNTNSGAVLRNITVRITGLLDKYVKISPEFIDNIPYGSSANFRVDLDAPLYKNYSKQELKAYVTGSFVQNGSSSSYSETQNILLTIQEISKEKTVLELSDAEKAIEFMKSKGYNTNEVSISYAKAKDILDKEGNNKESYDLSREIIEIRKKAQATDELIRTTAFVLKYPGKIKALTGLISFESIGDYKDIPLSLLLNKNKFVVNTSEPAYLNDSTPAIITGRAIGSIESLINTKPIEEMLSLAISAFERGDYNLASTRAESARSLLLLDLKGNFIVFIYLYWPIVLISIILLSLVSVLGHRGYQKVSINEKIADLSKKEDGIQKLFVSNQMDYYSGKISSITFNFNAAQYQKRLAQIRKDRVSLRDRRIRLLRPEQVVQGLDKEKNHVESEIIKLQNDFYKDKKISDTAYKIQFAALQERIAEIEDERLTFHFESNKDLGKKEGKREKEIVVKKESIFRRLINFIFDMRRRASMRDEATIKEKVERMLNKGK
jgi:hypothetical protein